MSVETNIAGLAGSLSDFAAEWNRVSEDFAAHIKTTVEDLRKIKSPEKRAEIDEQFFRWYEERAAS